MYSIGAYTYIIDLLQIRYEQCGGKLLPFERDLLLDAAESGIQAFILAAEQMFYAYLGIALMDIIDSSMDYVEYALCFYDSEDVFEALDLLQELICTCCPSHAENAAKRIEDAHIRVSVLFSLRR